MTSVVHISSSDVSGGAAIAAYRLHCALRCAGTSSRMAVRSRNSEDDSVVSLKRSSTEYGLVDRLTAKLYSIERRIASKAVSRELCFFSDDRVAGPNLLAGLPNADVLHLHWIANFLDYRRFFAVVPHGKPLVWTLHDMAPMTGGCHYSMRCEKFTQQCGACDLLGSSWRRDLTRKIHDRKNTSLAGLVPQTTRIVAPSSWLATEARRSSLLGKFKVDVIPNGLDVETFAPRDQRTARDFLGLPKDDYVVLFAADNVSDFRKGMDLLLPAIKGLNVGRSVTLVSVGGGSLGKLSGHIPLGRIENQRMMSVVYSAADIFVLPTRADNLPNVLIEAMACGTPCVSFRVGGVPDLVRQGQTGLLAEPEDVTSLKGCIETLLQDDALRAKMMQKCRIVAVQEYSDTIAASKYNALYGELIEGSRTLSAGNKD